MAFDTDNWPSLAEELGRKTSAQLEKWTTAYEAGTLSKREYYITVSALYDATSGIIDKAVSNLLADIHRDLRAK